ncbi:MAG TPA: alpha/beta hydrolase [Propionibacteriaceae bacterium]|jgi:pimeloyl-ACP methyl ester carboxylesterase|nr:alpha/beta hydrolase [Propionibacteriaceae bacterium]
MVARNRLAEGVGLIAGVAAMAMGGIAAGLELEQRLVSKRIARTPEAELAEFFALRSDGPALTTADGVVLHTEVDEGPNDDVTLVWIHGYALNLDNWHFQRRHFRGRVRQVFYDLRSHGRSSRSAPEHCRLNQLAIDLEQVLDEVAGPGPVVLIGHSMGGMTIMRLAASRPELFGTRVVGVGLLHTSAGELAEHSPIRGIPGRAFSRVAEPLMASLNRIPELVQRTRRAGSDMGYVATRRLAFASDVPPSYVEYVSEMLASTPLDVVADFYPAFRELDEYEALDGLSKLPVLVVGGENDLFTPVVHTDRISERLPDAVALRLPNCGHLGMIERPDRVNEAVEDLLDRVRAAR